MSSLGPPWSGGPGAIAPVAPPLIRLRCYGVVRWSLRWRSATGGHAQDRVAESVSGVESSRRFLGGVGVTFLITPVLGVGFFCLTSTPEVQLDHFIYITLLSWEALLKWYNFFWNFCWNREFFLRTKISTDC